MRGDDDEPKNQSIPTLVLRINGQIHKFPLINLALPNGKTLSPRFVDWASRKIDLTGADAGKPNLMTLAEYRMPLDLTCFFFTIDGEGIGEPNYWFQFIGTEATPNRIDAISSEPFIFEMVGQAGKLLYVQIGYKWQSLVILKSQSRDKSFCSETHNANILSSPPHHRQQVVNLRVRPHLDPNARSAEIRRLAKGYELMRKLWGDVRKPRIKFTEEEAQEKSDTIIAGALSHIATRVWGKQADLKIEPLARSMRIGKQTIYDVDAACRFYGKPGLIERLKEAYKQKRKSQAKKSKPS